MGKIIMTLTQIKYFIEVAKCLNFSEAAEHLFITQPALSRQITAIETELNMQLFIRGSKKLSLTPSGQLLLSEFTKFLQLYDTIIDKAREVHRGISGQLSIGIIDGYDIGSVLPEFIEYMEQNYPNIRISMQRLSFRKLIEELYNHTLDAVITYDFHMKDKTGLTSLPIQLLYPVMSVPTRNPLSRKDAVTLKDFEHEPLVIVKEAECSPGVSLVIDTCLQFGHFYPDFYFTETMEDAILWVESGLRCALFNTGMTVMHSDKIRSFPLPELPPMHGLLCWHPQNTNFALKILTDYFQNKKPEADLS